MAKLGYTLSSEDRPAYGQLHVCWAEDADAEKELALKQWPNSAISGSYFLELPLPAYFEEAAEVLETDDIDESIVCGPDPERHRAAIQEYVDAGYDHIYVHQIGPDQEGFFAFYEREVLPSFR